jgi:phosphoribosyl 1,2-cyclic phosphodiesterase
MLRSGPYPYPLKRRVASDFGHLSNEAAAQLLEKVRHARLQHVVAAHISLHNNQPALAAKALSAVLGCSEEWIGIAGQDDGLDWRQIA